MKIKKNDEVKIIRGKDKGKTGNVDAVLPKEEKVVVNGMNQYKRHMKGGKVQGQRSEIITLTKPLPVSSVILLCPKCHEAARVGYRFEKDKKVRYCKKCEQTI